MKESKGAYRCKIWSTEGEYDSNFFGLRTPGERGGIDAEGISLVINRIFCKETSRDESPRSVLPLCTYEEGEDHEGIRLGGMDGEEEVL
jgi:hypothetical protein